jgi:hypothetical protein
MKKEWILCMGIIRAEHRTIPCCSQNGVHRIRVGMRSLIPRHRSKHFSQRHAFHPAFASLDATEGKWRIQGAKSAKSENNKIISG